MSARKRLFSDYVQSQNTPYNQPSQSKGTSRSKKSQVLTSVDVNITHPGSARGILRRLAKITAGDTKKRVVTPSSAHNGKENVVQEAHIGGNEPIKRPNFSIEESIEEDDSEIPTAPTPSALLDDSDEDEQPTSTFQNLDLVLSAEQRVRSEEPQSAITNSVLDDSLIDEDDGSTMLTERGRRAVSEEPTRMSRYSFGSIRMSDFGSTLEVKRASGGQNDLQDISVLSHAYDHVQGAVRGGRLDNETDILHDLVPPCPQPEEADTEIPALQVPADEETFQLDMSDVVEDVVEAPQLAHQYDSRAIVTETDSIMDDEHDFVKDNNGAMFQDFIEEHNIDDNQQFDTIPEGIDDDDSVRVPYQDDEPSPAPGPASSRRQTLLEAVAADMSKPSRKKRLKMNQRGNAVPSLPSNLIKRVVHESQVKANKRKTTLGKEHMAALEQATEWFFEQASEDLAEYAKHSRRKTRIDGDDALLLMRRQRVLRQRGELRGFAKEWLPREILNELDLPD